MDSNVGTVPFVKKTSPFIVAIAGNGHGAGKTTFGDFIADVLARVYSLQSIRLPLALPLKDFCTDLYGVPFNWVTKDEYNKEIGAVPRSVLIDVGQALTSHYPTIFVEALCRRVKRDFANENFYTPSIIIVDDLRFQVELETLKKTFPNAVLSCFIERKKAKNEFKNASIDANLVHEMSVRFSNNSDLGRLYTCACDIAKEIAERVAAKEDE